MVCRWNNGTLEWWNNRYTILLPDTLVCVKVKLEEYILRLSIKFKLSRLTGLWIFGLKPAKTRA